MRNVIVGGGRGGGGGAACKHSHEIRSKCVFFHTGDFVNMGEGENAAYWGVGKCSTKVRTSGIAKLLTFFF